MLEVDRLVLYQFRYVLVVPLMFFIFHVRMGHVKIGEEGVAPICELLVSNIDGDKEF